ncbi:MAG TPA: ABC transporter substrate-binding protein [Pilimelia sp.]|nr:ABC transporter substrate-binding protein [Pilimelia sp.]
MRFIRSAAMASLACGLLLAPVTGCDLATESEDNRDVVIAADLELSGPAADIGTAYERALRLKVEQLNAVGATGERKIRLEVRDNRSDTNISLKNIGDFGRDTSVTAIVSGACSRCAIQAWRTINEARVPTIALAPASQVTEPVNDRRYVFKLAPNAADTAAALTTELRRVKVKRVGMLLTDDPYGGNGLGAMTRELDKAGIELIATRQVKTTDTDVTQPMAAITDADPDAIVVWTFAEQAGLAATSARSAGYTGRLFFDSAGAGELFLTGATAAAAEGVTMVFPQTMVIDDVIATTPAKAARKQWFRDYTARYGGYFGYASFAADAAQLIVDAVNRVGGVDRDRLRDVLETSQLDGLSGPIRITPDNHSGLTPQALAMLVARSGRWRLAG